MSGKKNASAKSQPKAVKLRSSRKSESPNRITEMVYQTAKGLHDAGAISKTTMREFEDLCLPKVPSYTPEQIKEIRERCKASQRIFAAYLNISPSALQKWESGVRKPDSVAFKLLSLVDKRGLEALVV